MLVLPLNILITFIVTETNPPEICAFKIPEIGDVCFKFYDVQLQQYHFCLNMTVKLDIIHKIPLKKIHVGCFDGKKGIVLLYNLYIVDYLFSNYDNKRYYV